MDDTVAAEAADTVVDGGADGGCGCLAVTDGTSVEDIARCAALRAAAACGCV